MSLKELGVFPSGAFQCETCPDGLRPICNRNKHSNFAFYSERKTDFEREKFAINFRFKQEYCNIIAQPSYQAISR